MFTIGPRSFVQDQQALDKLIELHPELYPEVSLTSNVPPFYQLFGCAVFTKGQLETMLEDVGFTNIEFEKYCERGTELESHLMKIETLSRTPDIFSRVTSEEGKKIIEGALNGRQDEEDTYIIRAE